VLISTTLWWKPEIKQKIHTFTKCTNVETIAQRSMLCSADSSHNNGRYWIREPEYGLIANPTRSTMNDSTYKTCIWKKKKQTNIYLMLISQNIKIKTIIRRIASTVLLIYISIYIYTRCNRRNVRDFGRVFLMLNYADITQNIYIQS